MRLSWRHCYVAMFATLSTSAVAFRPHLAMSRPRGLRMMATSSSSKAVARPLKVGLVGGGVVGGGVYQLVERCAQSGRLGEVGAAIDIAKICVRDATKKRDYDVKASTTFVTNVDDILNDPSINCVVELMGGVTTAKVSPPPLPASPWPTLLPHLAHPPPPQSRTWCSAPSPRASTWSPPTRP